MHVIIEVLTPDMSHLLLTGASKEKDQNLSSVLSFVPPPLLPSAFKKHFLKTIQEILPAQYNKILPINPLWPNHSDYCNTVAMVSLFNL